MKTEIATSKVLRYSMIVSITIIVIGIILNALNIDSVTLYVGVLLLVLTPIFSVITTTVFLAKEKDWKWFRMAVLLIVISAAGIALSTLYML